MRPRIKTGILVTSTTLAKRAQARRLEIEVKYIPRIIGATILSTTILGIK